MASSALGHFTENNIDLPQNLTTSRLELQPSLETPTNFVSKEVKNTLENLSQNHHHQVIVKSENHQIHAEPQQQQNNSTSNLDKNDFNNSGGADTFDKFIKRAKKYDPLLLWGVLRPKVLNNVTLWDILVDKTVLQAQAMPVGNVPSERLRIMLNEICHLILLLGEALEHCCESHVKIEASEGSNAGSSLPNIGKKYIYFKK